MNRRRLQALTRNWQRMLRCRDALFACGGLILILAPLFWVNRTVWQCALAGGALLFCPAFLHHRRSRLPQAVQVARHLDRTCPQLEESSALWLRPPETLTRLERLQLARLDRIAERWSDPSSPDPFPGRPPWTLLRGAALFLVGTMCLLAAAGWLVPRRAARQFAPRASSEPRAAAAPPVVKPLAPVWPRIVGAELAITPPAYTARPARTSPGLDAEIEENSVVAWSIALDQPVRDVRLVFNASNPGTLPLQLSPDSTHLRGSRPLADTGFYSLAGTLPDGTAWNPPDLHTLKIIKDQPPTLRILQPGQARTVIVPPPAVPFLFLPFRILPLPSSFTLHPSSFSVVVLAGDDYGLTDTHLVATVAKGSGEAVKFREQTIPFDGDSPTPDLPHGRRLTRTLDLAALGLDPGDELYFFVESLDNRRPIPNRTRSETRFVTLQGPATRAATPGRGVSGVNLVPPFFRSERQLIIDTEKLLADRATLPDADFRDRANDLGADQALLRLRYGRFLGEDQEESAVTDHAETVLDPLQAGAPETHPGPDAAVGIAQRFQQEHEEQARGGGDGGTPRPAPERPLGAEEIRAPYVDEHDSQDAATLFDRASKGTMRDALSAMWQAEGMLRTARPRDALAPEHRALDVLKAVQESDRAYVQHVGFEAPPLKVAERRLKGDVSDVPAHAVAAPSLAPADPAVADVRAALAALARPGPVSPEILRGVEPVLTAAATRRPDDFLPGLQALRRIASDPAADPALAAPALESALLRLLPPVRSVPALGTSPAPSLDAPYFQALQVAGP